MGDEIPDEEKIAIASRFMLSSPPGEFNEVVTDVRALVDNDALLNKTALQTFRTFNCDQMIAVDMPGKDYKVLVTEHGEIDTKTYMDPRGDLAFTFDHVKQQITDTKSHSSGSSVDSLRGAVDDAIVDYVNEFFPEGCSAVYAKGSKVIICISAAKFNPSNFWNGRWRSVWTYENGTLTGTVKANVHYYEDGNVQLTASYDRSDTISAGDDATTAKAIVTSMTQQEGDVQLALNEKYHTMGETTFKALRRKLPITHTKLDFYKIAQHKVIGEMSSK